MTPIYQDPEIYGVNLEQKGKMRYIDYFNCWIAKSALLDFQDNSQPLFIIMLSSPIGIVQWGLWEVLLWVIVWGLYWLYFTIGRCEYLSSIQKLYHQEQNIHLTFK